MIYMRLILKKNVFAVLISVWFLILSVWWIAIAARGLKEGFENNAFTLIYPFFSLIGGGLGLIYAKRWGGFRSYFGASLSFFAFGLLAQFLGQAVYAYYIYVIGIEVPYPSLGDVGYFGSVLFYILGIFVMGKVLGLKNLLKSKRSQVLAIILPSAMLVLSYFVFLRDYSFDWSNPIKIILDFGYPLGEAMYVSIAILNILLSAKILGGMMRGPTRFMIFALVVQYFSDFTFLYQANQGAWYVGGVNDYMYLVSYFLMTIALLYMGGIFQKIRET